MKCQWCMCVIFEAALRDAYKHTHTRKKTIVCISLPLNMSEHASLLYIRSMESKEYRGAHRLHHFCVKCKMGKCVS